jgi:hypothetical protein
VLAVTWSAIVLTHHGPRGDEGPKMEDRPRRRLTCPAVKHAYLQLDGLGDIEAHVTWVDKG